YLAKLLPEYMVPSRFVFLDSFPLTPNGNIDRKALPAATEQQKPTSKFEPASDQVEEMLVGIWEKVLKVKPVGVTDDFFDLGGHSLLALRVSVEIEKQCQIKLPLASLFTTSTIRELAATLRESLGTKTASAWSSFVVMQPQGTKPPLFLVHGAGGNLLLYRALAKRLAPDFPLYGFQSLGLDGESQPLKTIEEMAAHYVRELRSFQPHGPYHLGGYCMGGTISYEMARILTSEGEQVPLVAMLDTYNFSRALKVNISSFILEKTKFHMANIAQLNPIHMFHYLREKIHHGLNGELANLKGSVQSNPDDIENKVMEDAESTIHTINDYAVHHFDPKPYSGQVTLFKPRINYKFYPDPQLGWGDLVQGKLGVIEASAYPHAMLLEPYVEILAEQLKEQISGTSALGDAPAVLAPRVVA
ncbi:MAG: alpha/beta fold hydrolase, partial [Nitrososphaerales archaeon]